MYSHNKLTPAFLISYAMSWAGYAYLNVKNIQAPSCGSKVYCRYNYFFKDSEETPLIYLATQIKTGG